MTTGTSLAAGSFTVLDVSFTASTFMPIGSVSSGVYHLPISAYSTTAPYTIVWDGSAVLSFNAASNAGVDGLIVGDDALYIIALFGTDSYGSHVPGDWEFQSADFTFQRGSDLVITPRPIPVPHITLANAANTSIANGGSQAFGSIRVGSDTTLTFTIGNAGNADLTGLVASIDPPGDFSVAAQPASSSIPGPGGSTAFQIRFAPTTGAVATGTLHVASNDSGNNPFTVNLTGAGLADCVVSDWSGWSGCCNGTQSRSRTVLIPASAGGAACPPLTESRACVNAHPVIALTWPIAGASYPIATPLLFTASFTDTGSATHTGAWTIGGVTEPSVITEPAEGSSGSASLQHIFASAGSYAVTLRVSGDCAGIDSAKVTVTASSYAPPAFPVNGVLDDFNRANGSIGANWTDSTAAYAILSNRLAPAGGESYIEWKGSTYGPNQEVFLTLSTIQATAPEHNLMLKTQGATWRSGHIEVSYDATTYKVTVSTYTPGAGFTSRGTLAGVTFGAGDRFGARAFASGALEVYRNSTLLGTVSVNGWTYAALGGRIGISTLNAPSARFDNFGGGDFAPTSLLGSPLSGNESIAGVMLSSAYPNPTTGAVAFSLQLPHEDDVDMRIMDLLGREVWRAAERHVNAGRWTLEWDGKTALGSVPAGVYLARIRVARQQLLRRIAVVR